MSCILNAKFELITQKRVMTADILLSRHSKTTTAFILIASSKASGLLWFFWCCAKYHYVEPLDTLKGRSTLMSVMSNPDIAPLSKTGETIEYLLSLQRHWRSNTFTSICQNDNPTLTGNLCCASLKFRLTNWNC